MDPVLDYIEIQSKLKDIATAFDKVDALVNVSEELWSVINLYHEKIIARQKFLERWGVKTKLE